MGNLLDADGEAVVTEVEVGDLLDADGEAVVTEEIDDLEDIAVDLVDKKKYCSGITPSSMTKDIFLMFPFQMIPELKIVSFSGQAFHHIDCERSNFILSLSLIVWK